eukprot:CAMPEP_0172587038 /NCGR_PEP_ID=MMETSP1068-20121228/6190_1 /TAXON_ID=35684 /ORGANISM="Pseudopedinella elastica, Strain CCMP716" /LENGTH=396 /DNA_ID=CAMNT_0013381945 /DNA_START=27 /DNA_END=1217 /DNA_ORIENTATION=-
MSTESAQAKARGVEAYKAKRFEDAVKEFSTAIETASSESELDGLHLVYSNRSACQQQLGQWAKGAEDAEASTQTKPSFAKGYAHLGLCKLKLGLFDESISAYRKAGEFDPSKAAEYLKASEAAKQAKKRAPAPVKAASLRSVGQLLLWCVMFVNAFAYLLTFTKSGVWLRARSNTFTGAYLVQAGLRWLQTHGLPRFTIEYAQRVLSDKSVQRVTSGLLLLMGPNMVIMLSVLLPEVALCFATMVGVLRAGGFTSMGDRVASSLTGTLLDPSGTAPYWKVGEWASKLEVAALVQLILALPTPKSNLMQLILWGQNLQLRYTLETATQQTSGGLHGSFSELDVRVTGFLGKVPVAGPLALRAYGGLKGLLAGLVKQPEPGKPRTGLAANLASKCTVM